jgi:hypothetical protein
MASPNLNVLTQAARVFLQKQPSTTELSALVTTVDQGVESLPQAIIRLASSSSRVIGYTDELTRLFFVLFDRPPDLATFSLAMGMLESGAYSLSDIARIGLNYSSSLLSNSLNLSNKSFVYKLASLVFTDYTSILGLNRVLDAYVLQLDNFSISRQSLLSLAVQYDDTNVRYHNYIEVALDYLATTGQAPSTNELISGQLLPETILLRQNLTSVGISAYGTALYFDLNGTSLVLSGSASGDFKMDLSNWTSTLAGGNNYRIFLTKDGGFSESSQLFDSSLLKGTQNIDATGLGVGIKTFTLQASSNGGVVKGPNVPSILTGGLGNDTFFAGSANTKFISNGGTDLFNGGPGDDSFYAGSGKNTLFGGLGKDTFVLPDLVTIQSKGAITIITDFGNGLDMIDLTAMSGNVGAGKSASSLIIGSSERGAGMVNAASVVNNSVMLVFNTGKWVDDATGGFGTRTNQQIANLFTETYNIPAVGNTQASTGTRSVTFTKQPTIGQNYFVFVYDSSSGVDIFEINNLTPLNTVTPNEVTLVGHMNLNSYANLWAALNTNGSILL